MLAMIRHLSRSDFVFLRRNSRYAHASFTQVEHGFTNYFLVIVTLSIVPVNLLFARL
jgi:hypothetical protein